MRARARRFFGWIGGAYEGDGFVVESRHWWSRKDRKAARTAAAILEHEGDNIRARTRAAARELLIYGYTGPDSWKTDIPAKARRL